jgi:hypothetical protein
MREPLPLVRAVTARCEAHDVCQWAGGGVGQGMCFWGQLTRAGAQEAAESGAADARMLQRLVAFSWPHLVSISIQGCTHPHPHMHCCSARRGKPVAQSQQCVCAA